MLLVALHGHPLDRRLFAPLTRLAEDGDLGPGVRVFAPDFRGRGTSRRPATGIHTMPLLADDVAADLAELVPDEPVVLLGVSMGGYVLFELLRRHRRALRERLLGLVLCDTKAGADDQDGQARRRSAVETIRARGMGALREPNLALLLSSRSRGTEVEDSVARMIVETPAETACADQLGMLEREDGFEALSQVTVPVLLVVGEDDAVSPPAEAEAMAEAVSGAPYVRFLTVPEAGHLAVLEKPRDVGAAIAELLARV